MTKITLLSALTALLILPSIASAASTADFDATTNATWKRVVTLATIADGESSHGQQQMMMNITALPEGGAKSQSVRSLANAQFYYQPSPFKTLALGQNYITIVAAADQNNNGNPYDRAVKVRFDSDEIEFDALTINGVDQLATTAAEGTQGQVNSQTISESTDIFDTTANATWVRNATLVLNSQGPAVSSLEQTLVIDVTYIPAGGANYRVYKTTDPATGGGANFGAAQALVLDENTITVPAVSYNRSVKIQFDNVDVEFDALTINGVDSMPSTPDPAQGTQGQVNSQTISESTDIFAAITNNSTIAEGWVTVATMTTTGDAAPSQGAQTLEMNVTYIPEGGAQMRSYNSNENPGATFSDSQTLTLGPNTITVPDVTWANSSQGRATKVQFSSVAIEFDALTFNDVPQIAVPAAGTPGNGAPISDSPNVIPVNYNGTLYVATMANLDDGAASQVEQTAVINVTYIPAGGATWSLNSTNELGNYITVATQYLQIGLNTITVDAVDYDRIVKLRFSSDAIEFDALTFNGVNPLAVDDGGDTVTIANSNLFNAGPDATWVAVLTTAVSQDGDSSRSQQTVAMNITSLPAGANYRVVKTVADGTWDTGDSQPLVFGANTITVNSVGFDRSVKIEFSSDAVEYDALSVNDATRVIGADAVAVPSVSINGSTLTWTQADGTTLQFSDDLETWTSLPSATSPYSPSTTPDRFYRTISEEAE